jgi:hypothetical protein
MTTNSGRIPEDTDDVLVCEYEKRPRGAPSFFDLHDAIRQVGFEGDTLRVDFAPDYRQKVEQLAAAERLCCPTIDFDLSSPPAVTVWMRGTPGQLATLQQMLAMEMGEEPQVDVAGWRENVAMVMERAGTLTPAEQQLHHAILRAFPRLGGAPDAAWLAAHAVQAGAKVTELAAKDVIQLDPASGVIVAAYPFSGVPTAHKVEIAGGMPVYAMCAIDALGIPFMLGVDAVVRSIDPMTGETIRINVREGTATWEPVTACMFAGCVEGDGPVSQTLCPTINFFVSPASAEAYAAAHPEITGQVLAQAAAVRSGRCSFGELLSTGPDVCAPPCESTRPD